MKCLRSPARVLLPLVVGLALIATAAAANAAPARPDAGRAPVPIVGASADAATGTSTKVADINACPVPGQRVKTSYSPEVYLVNPNWELYYIPGNVYFNLWDSYGGIITNDSLWPCYNSGVYEGLFTLSSSWLAKTASSPKVYIYDSTWGEYRWITSGEIFNKYGFSWGKIHTQSSVTPVGLNWDF